MTSDRAVCLLSQVYLPCFDDEEKEALTMAINAIQTIEYEKEKLKHDQCFITNHKA